jgi:hypothetical protein
VPVDIAADHRWNGGDSCLGRMRLSSVRVVTFIRTQQGIHQNRMNIRLATDLLDPNDLYEYLSGARQRPSMYVHNLSLMELEAQCHGYETALYCHGIKEFGNNFCKRFRDYLNSRFGWPTCIGWARVIRDACETDEQAWDRFFELLDDFHQHVT